MVLATVTRDFTANTFVDMHIKQYIPSTKTKDLPCTFSLSETPEGMASIQYKKKAFKSNKVPKNGKYLT